jgi:hypothetical protein
MTKMRPQGSDDADKSQDKDADLVTFLRQHTSPVPEPAAGEEDRLMMAIAKLDTKRLHQMIASSSSAPASGAKRQQFSLKKRLGIAAVCSVLVYVAWQMYQAVIPTHQSVRELAELEDFWFQNWDRAANAEDVSPWLAERDPALDLSQRQPLKSRKFNRAPSRQE